jgi:4-amino-4-deoxy-L-arabinose transferase-like glycosyltransferase
LATPDSKPRAAQNPLASLLLIACAGAAIHLPWIGSPFGPNEVNSTSYFGPFAQSFARFGFTALRGIPVAGYGLAPLGECVPYLNHPPATAWLSSFGTAEWQVRLPFAIGQTLAGCVLFALLRRRIEPWRATVAGAILVVLPVFAFYGRTIYDAFTVLFGLLLFWGFDLATREGAPRRPGAAGILAASAFAGVWMDWPFVFWIGGLAAFLPGPGIGHRAKWLVVPCVAGAVGAASVLAWQKWATSSPDLPFALPPPQGAILLKVLRDPLPLPELWAGLRARFPEAFSFPVLVAAALGLVPIAARAPRLVTGLLLASAAHVLVFSRHARSHPAFSSDFGPLLAAAACAFPSFGRRSGRWVAAALAFAALAGAAATSVARLREADTPFLRDVGAAFDELSADVRADGSLERVHRVRHNLPMDFPYYIRSPFTRPRVVTLSEVQRDLFEAGPDGLRYVWFDVRTAHEPVARATRIEPALAAWLGGLPSRSLPALARTIEIPGDDQPVRVVECRVYDLKK